jgi:hypothetical protein
MLASTTASNLVPNNEVKVFACNFTSYEKLSIPRNPLIFGGLSKNHLLTSFISRKWNMAASSVKRGFKILHDIEIVRCYKFLLLISYSRSRIM